MHPQCDSCWGHWAARPSVSKKTLSGKTTQKKPFAPTGLCGVQAIGSPRSQSTQILIQDPGSRILEPGPQIQDPKNLDPGSWTQDAGSKIEDPGSWIWDPGSRIQDPGS